MDQPGGFLLYGLMVVLDKAANPEKGGGFCVIARRSETDEKISIQ